MRIVSTAPSLTETLFALGVGDRVVAVSDWCHRPEAAQRLPRIGGFANPSVEAILAQRPDLVLFVEGLAETARQLESMGISTLVVRSEDLAEIQSSTLRIAERVGAAERGRELVGEMREALQEVEAAASAGPRPRVLMVISRATGSLGGLTAVGPVSFLGEPLDLAGGHTVAADTGLAYPKLSLEEILARDPEVIIEVVGMAYAGGAFEEKAAEARALWGAYPGLTAVRRDAVVPVLDDALFQPGPRVVDQARQLAGLLRRGTRAAE
jgi:iron complex transport system substrate-binding protein